LQAVNKGINFLGYFIKPDYMLVRKKVVSRFKNKLYSLKDENTKKIQATINSYFGHFKHAFTFNLRKNIYENHLGELQNKFLPKLNYSSLKIK
jgi:glutamyl-tRNA reductase